MADVQLIVNDEPLDLKRGERIPLNLQAQIFSKLSEKVGGFSRSFVVPRTDKNMRLLEKAMVFNTTNKFPYRVNKAVLVANGIEISDGNLIVENNGIKQNEIRLTFYTGNSIFFQVISEYNLLDINIPNAEHLYTFTEIYERNLPNPYALPLTTTDIFYPIIDNSTADDYLTDLNNFVPWDRLLPAMRWAVITTAVEELTGYTFKGKLFESETWKQLFYPTSSRFERDKRYADRNTWEFQSAFSQLRGNTIGDVYVGFPNLEMTTKDNVKYLEGQRIDGNTILPYYAWSGVSTCFMFSDRVRLHLKFSCKLKVNATNEFYFLWGEQGVSYLQWFTTDPNEKEVLYFNTPINAKGTLNNGVNSYNFYPAIVNPPANYQVFTAGSVLISPTEYDFVLEFDIDVDPHKRLVFQNYTTFVSATTLRFDNLKTECTYVRDNGTSESDRQIKLLNYKDDSGLYPYSSALINGTTPLPDIKISEFLKDICYLFNCLLIVDDELKEINFFTLAELYENIPAGYDWSDKVVNIDNAQWNTRAVGYGQNSYLKYDNENTAWDVFSNKNLLVDDTTLPAGVDVIKLRYSASPMRTTYEVFPSIAKIELLDNDLNFSKKKQRILLLNDLNAPLPQWATYTMRYENIPPVTPNDVYIVDKIGRLVYGYFNIVGVFPFNTTTAELGFAKELFDNYYKYLQYITDSFKQLEVEIILQPTDVNEIDFRKPVYLSQFSSWFYIEKINDWIAGTPCKITLLKIN